MKGIKWTPGHPVGGLGGKQECIIQLTDGHYALDTWLYGSKKSEWVNHDIDNVVRWARASGGLINELVRSHNTVVRLEAGIKEYVDKYPSREDL